MSERAGSRVALIALALSGMQASHAGELVAIGYNSGILYNVNSFNAALTAIGSTGVKGAVDVFADIQFAPDGTLYGFTAEPNASVQDQSSNGRGYAGWSVGHFHNRRRFGFRPERDGLCRE
jgi:hypothetical protein